jgi:hypothetical protein
MHPSDSTLSPRIYRHPRLSTGVIFEVLRNGFAIEDGAVVENTLEASVSTAKKKISALFPTLNLDGIYVYLPND